MFWENPYQNQLWIASGVGIAVFLGALHSYPIKSGPRIHLIFTSNEANLIFYSEFEAAKAKFNFTYEYSSEGGFRLVEKLTQNCDFFDQFDYFRICGHPDFQKAINRLLLDFGISKKRIRLEGLW
jgi:predicted ferric reductase